MRVVFAVASLKPSHGGPAFSVSRLARSLAESGLDVGLWAADQSARSTPLLPVEAPLIRLTGTETEALDSFGKVDLLHDNGIWLRHNHRLARLATQRRIPRIVSPRGMLEPWALKHKRWKKKLAWRLYQRRDLACASHLHTTAEQETLSVQRLGLAVPVCMVPNGVDCPGIEPTSADEQSEARGAKVALFVGRIHPKKGLPMLIEAWAKIRPEGWTLRIAGPDEEGHRAELEKAVSTRCLSGIVSFLGPLDGVKKSAAFFDADLFVLPTHSENFGVVVAEALAHGLPVVTTTAAPWSVLGTSGCGWQVEPTVEGIGRGLIEATSSNEETLRSMGVKGRDVVETNFTWEEITKNVVSMYRTVLDQQASLRASIGHNK